MNPAQIALLAVITATSTFFLAQWFRTARSHREYRRPTFVELVIGAVTNFFDALGVGSFPTSTSIFRLRRMLRDEDLPGTLNIGHAPAAIAEALIFIAAVKVDPLLLGCTTLATALGAWTGAGMVARAPPAALRLVLGSGCLVAGLLFVAVNMDWIPGGGEAFALSGWKFGVAVVVLYVLGALMAAGVGLFGPCMITLSLLGMHPIAAFPIMMSAGALQQLISGIRYLKLGRYAFGTAVGLGVGGVIGVIIAAFFVRSLSVTALRWLVAIVSLYVSFVYLRSGLYWHHRANPSGALPITPVEESYLVRAQGESPPKTGCAPRRDV